jgi:hypothetical protein
MTKLLITIKKQSYGKFRGYFRGNAEPQHEST